MESVYHGTQSMTEALKGQHGRFMTSHLVNIFFGNKVLALLHNKQCLFAHSLGSLSLSLSPSRFRAALFQVKAYGRAVDRVSKFQRNIPKCRGAIKALVNRLDWTFITALYNKVIKYVTA